jgi:hypothetical protein
MDSASAKVITDIINLPTELLILGISIVYFSVRGIADTIADIIIIYLYWLLGDTIDDWIK